MFTRRRKLSFDRVVILLLQRGKMALQTGLNRFFKTLGECRAVATASALCQARQKVCSEVFGALHALIINFFYRQYGSLGLVRRWKGHRILATDATYVNLPDTSETRLGYSIQKNQHKHTGYVQAMGSCLYDVLNEIALNFVLGPVQAEKRYIFDSHVASWQAGDVILYDRLYADYAIIAYHFHRGMDFVIRCPLSQTFHAVHQFLTTAQTDMQVMLRVTDRAKAFVRAQGLPEVVHVRLVTVTLPTGTVEVLMTSLLDASQYSSSDLARLYQQRWGVETYFDRLKNLLDLERISSTKLEGVLQDIHACVFLSTLTSLLCHEPEHHLQLTDQSKQLKYVYKVNQGVAYPTVTAFLVELFIHSPRPLAEVIQDLHHLLQRNPFPIRPGRRYKRNKRKTSEQLRYLKYGKRLWT